MRKSGYYYIYPAYFEAGRSRQSGRRIPRKMALHSVDTKMIVQAAQRLNLEYQVNNAARYPTSWWATPGVVLIKKPENNTKTQILKQLAKVMKSLKEAGAS